MKIIANRKDSYSHFVIIPHFLEGGENAYEIINSLSNENLILLDKIIGGINFEYGAVYESFETDIYSVLIEALDKLEKYHTIKLIFPYNSYYSNEIQKGLIKFCQDYAFKYQSISHLEKEKIESGVLYINVNEDDLVMLIEKIIESNYILGKEVGIISYNETPLKKITS